MERSLSWMAEVGRCLMAPRFIEDVATPVISSLTNCWEPQTSLQHFALCVCVKWEKGIYERDGKGMPAGGILRQINFRTLLTWKQIPLLKLSQAMEPWERIPN